MNATTQAKSEIMIQQDGEAEYLPNFLKPDQAQDYFDRLRQETAWHEEEITLFGRPVKVPRLVAWYGDPGAVYQYSGVVHQPLPWLPVLLELKGQVENCVDHRFNSVLLNLYRDGSDHMGWHCDNEKELGPNPLIASLSLGAEREFRLQHKKTKIKHSQLLGAGSLLIMRDGLQDHWRHCIVKTKKAVGERINLTFRRVKGSEQR